MYGASGEGGTKGWGDHRVGTGHQQSYQEQTEVYQVQGFGLGTEAGVGSNLWSMMGADSGFVAGSLPEDIALAPGLSGLGR